MATYSDFVRDEGYGRPIPGATVKLFSSDGTTEVAMTTTGADGGFTLSAPDGKYLLDVSFGGASARSSVIVGDPPEYIGPTGPADNTYTSYAGMQASDPSRQSARLVGDTDVPAHADGPYNNPTQTVGGWVPQGATGIATKPGWTVAPARDMESKANDIASIFDVIPAARHQAIQARTTDYEATADLRKAIIDSAAQRLRLVLPAGVYNVRPDVAFASEAGACLNALPLPSYLDLSGPGATLRVVDGVSTDLAPRLMSLFGTNGTPHDVSIGDVVLDMNGANNRISPQRGEHIFNRFPQAAIYVSGTPSGVAARMDDVMLKRLTIQNGPGVSCIVMAQSNTDGVTLGRRWKLENCLLQNTGNDTDDCSFVFAWADDVTTSGCTFRNDIQVDDYGTGGLVGYEVHGSNHKFINNTVDNFMQGMWIGENRTDDVNNTFISGNTFKRIKAVGIATFGNDSPFVTYNHNIINNTIIFDSLLHPGYALKQGVSVTSLYPRRDVTVDGLRVISPPGNPVASTATAVNAPTMEGIHDQLTFRNVRAWGTTFRHYGRTNALRGIGTLTLDGGEGINLTPAGVFGIAADISMDASGAQIDHLIIDRPNAIDFRIPSQCGYASFLTGKFGRLTLKPGDRRGMTLGGHVESATTVASRGGSFEKTVPIAPPTIAAGASFTTTVAFPAVSFGDNVSVGFSASLGGLIAQMPTAGAGVVEQTFTNPTVATIDLPALNATYITRKPA